MANTDRYTLNQDLRGMMWDILLYLPTVSGLGAGAVITWYGNNQSLTYLLLFLACFFLYQSIHRVLGRLAILPTSPMALNLSKKRVVIELKNGELVELVKNLRYYADYAGKSFGLTGMDLMGKQKQYVFHKGQFISDDDYKKVGGRLKIYT